MLLTLKLKFLIYQCFLSEQTVKLYQGVKYKKSTYIPLIVIIYVNNSTANSQNSSEYLKTVLRLFLDLQDFFIRN